MTIEELANIKMADVVSMDLFAKKLKDEWRNKVKYKLAFRVKLREVFGAEVLKEMPKEYIKILDKESKLSARERWLVCVYCENAFKKTMKKLLDESKKESPLGDNK